MINSCRFSVAVLFFVVLAYAVDKNNFKSCEQSSFCRRLRGIKPDGSKYKLDLDSLQITDSSLDVNLINTANDAKFKLTLTALVEDTFRILIDEINPIHPRYRVEQSLDGEPQAVSTGEFTVLDRNKDKVAVKFKDNIAILTSSPFKIEFYKGDILVSVINARGLFEIENLRLKKPEGEENNEAEGAEQPKEDPGAWEENFKSHHDSKPRGPEAVGVDITFPGALRAYGLPEHADKLPLRSTGPGNTEPYRLYNLDVFEYEIESTMALYGAVPVVYAHSPKNTVGVFWNNAAETWVDINNSKDTNVMSSLVSLVSGSRSDNRVDSHFMSESGVFDLFIFMGPKPRDVVRQYATITGTAPLPQYFTLGYHQCRWNYNDEDDVRSVVENFDLHDMPVDVMWLDIEYTDGKKYFTWDPIKFAHPEDMLNNLTSTGRKLVAIIDPHIKREGGYFVHEECLANGYYVKNKDGNVYEGWCWPGSSSYPDFLDPVVKEYFTGLYSLDKFKGSTNDLYIWNDMNEPSVFNGPEVTMPKDCLHHGGWEHRHIHNLYGMIFTMITYDGLVKRNSNRRPFILTRAHFAGSQRYTTVWTGDNAAEWSHLAISLPMCLSEALGGISFCGADIGGFFNNPDVELLQRWYQAGIWLPFYRAHAHIDTRRREPYLYNEDVRTRIRNALRLRYAHLPLFYTLFYEHYRTGDPVIRPIFYHYPEDTEAVDIDYELLLGNSILARPVTEAGVSTVNVYFPGGASEYWYDIEDYRLYTGTGSVNIPVTLDKIPAFYRGGSIIPRKDRPRRSSVLTRNDPYTLYVVLDSNKSAKGTLYIDDGESFDYKNKKYVYLEFEFKDNTLSSRVLDGGDFNTEAWLERVVVIGSPADLKSATLKTKGNVDLKVTYDGEGRSLVIRKPGVNIKDKFTITLQ